MRLRILQAIALAALTAPLPRDVAALDYSGTLGVRYSRTETWTPGEHALVPRLQLNGNLGARGYVFAPDLLRWSGSVGYEDVRETYGATEESSDGLTYQLRLAAFEKRNSTFTVNGSVARSQTDFAVDAPGGSSSTGLTTADSFDLGLTVAAPNRPAISVRGLHRESTNSGFGRATVEESADQVMASFSHGPGPYNVSGTYTGTWNEGTLSLSDYVLHAVGLTASTSFGDGTTGQLSATHNRRIPGPGDPLNPTTEANSVQSGVEWVRGATRGRVSYAYHHDLATAPALEARETFGHGGSLGIDHAFSDAWSAAANASLNLMRARLGDDELSSTGESLALLGRWHRAGERERLDVTVEAGPKIGLLQPADGGSEAGYGATARTRLALSPGRTRYGLDYLLDWESNLGGREGWVIRQQLQGDMVVQAGRDLSLRLDVTASGTRQEYRPFGANASRTATVRGTAIFPSASLALELGITDGLQAGLAESVSGDGLFFPESYDTHARYASLIGSATIARRLAIRSVLRYATQSGAGAPDQRQASASGVLSYTIGRVRLSLEDRYVAGGADALDQRSNLVLATLSRSFGGRF